MSIVKVPAARVNGGTNIVKTSQMEVMDVEREATLLTNWR